MAINMNMQAPLAMPFYRAKWFKAAVLSYFGVALLLKIFAAQGLASMLVGGLMAAILAVAITHPVVPQWVRSGLITGLVGVMFMLTYGPTKPAIALIGGMLGGLSAGLLDAQRERHTNWRRGLQAGAIAGAIAGALTSLALLLVWLVIAPAAGVAAERFAVVLQDTIPFNQMLGLGSDVMIIGWLALLTIALGGFMGGLAGAARAVPGQAGDLMTYAVMGLSVLLLPIINDSANLLLLNNLIPVYVFILLALGLNIVVGYAGLLDLGYAAFFAIGAYTAGILSSPHLDIHMNFWLIIWIAAAVAAIAGVILGAPTLPLRGDYLAIVTLGFGEIVPIMVRNLGEGRAGERSMLRFFDIPLFEVPKNLTGGVAGINPIDPPTLPGIAFTPQNQIAWYYLLVALMVFTMFFINRLRDSRQGRAWTAMREDELAADAMGINIVRTKLLAFAMGATFSGFAGAFYGAYLSAIFPTSFDFSVSIIVLCMVILGGLGNMAGVIVGGLLIMGADRMILPESANLLRAITREAGVTEVAAFRDPPQLRLLLFGLVLVIMMIVRPEGLLPNPERKAEFHADDDIQDQQNAELYDAERDPQLAGH